MAKAKKIEPKAKKSTAAALRRRRRARANPGSGGGGYAANPPMVADLTQVILPGFAAYAATRVISRIVYSVVQKRWPKLGKHAAALAGVVSAGGVWLFAHKVKALAKYHDGIVMGTSVAAAHGVATCYLPQKYSWLLTDCRPEDVQPAQTQTLAQQIEPLTAPTSSSGIEDEYSHLEAAAERSVAPPSRSSRRSAPPPAEDPDIAAVLDVGENVDDLYSGTFEN